jgi:hypothetical protein
MQRTLRGSAGLPTSARISLNKIGLVHANGVISNTLMVRQDAVSMELDPLASPAFPQIEPGNQSAPLSTRHLAHR